MSAAANESIEEIVTTRKNVMNSAYDRRLNTRRKIRDTRGTFVCVRVGVCVRACVRACACAHLSFRGLSSPTVLIAPCKRIHEGPGFRIPASRFRIPASGFWISTLWIPDSNLLDSDSIPKWVPDSKPLWIPDSSLWISDSNSNNLLDSGFRILLHGAILNCTRS